jgi:chromosome segregation protein
MRLLRLEITGFKSFCDKTALSFVQDGISIVVGPNGCGKSNIVDAVRWALGEQSAKHLRGTSMEDVIFNGSTSRSPVNLAQVTLVFSNPGGDTLIKYAEFTEIAITRRLYRSGESQYLINKTPCRLTDIRELFMDTGIGGKGYSIIEQGKIDQIVTSRAEDRRSIIDEAAGIVRFKAKRKEAERKLELTKQNLVRIEDIIAELQRQEASLRIQVERAEQYLHQKARLERLQQCTAATRWFELQQQTETVNRTTEANAAAIQDLKTALALLEVRESTLKLEMAGWETERDELQLSRQECKEGIIKLEGKLETETAALDHLEEWRKMEDTEAEQLDCQIEQLENQMADQEKAAGALALEISQGDEYLAVLSEKERLKRQALTDQRTAVAEQQEAEAEIRSRLSTASQQLEQYREKIAEAGDKLGLLIRRLTDLQTAENEFERRIASRREHLSIVDQKRAEVREKIQTLEEQYDRLVKERENATVRLQAVEKRHQLADNRYQTLQEVKQRHEGYDYATKTLLDHIQAQPALPRTLGFVGTLAELVSPPESARLQSLAFLNRYFNLLIFENVERLEAIAKLVEALGVEQLQLYFMDLASDGLDNRPSDIKWITGRSDRPSDVPLAGEFHAVDRPLYRFSKEELLASGGLVDPEAMIMTRSKIFLVGKPGSSNQAESFFDRQQELEQLEHERPVILAEIDAAETEMADNEERMQELDNTLKRYRREGVDIDLERVRLEKEIDAEEKEQRQLVTTIRDVKNEQAQVEASLALVKEKLEETTQAVKGYRNRQQELLLSLSQLRSTIETTASNRQEESDELQQLKIKLAGLEEKYRHYNDLKARMQKDLSASIAKRREIRTRADETRGKQAWYSASIKKAKAGLPGMLTQLHQLEEQIKHLSNRIETGRSELTDAGSQMQKETRKISLLTEKNHKLDIQRAQLVQEARNIADNMFAEHRVTPEEMLETFAVNEFDNDKEAETIVELKRAISLMDDVNLAAKKEYDVLKERLDFLTTQSADLVQGMEALENAIQRINQESRRRFRETFKAVNEQFRRLFPLLFGGGDAYLELTDESDLLETGVDIIAKPPGKKRQNMTLLSGGEKALTALALVFAVFEIKPSPFCLLDEVDAPLDDANNVRFGRHVKLLTAHSQFIIITHNKKTMEIGDALFGVTMEEPGISKIVSVDFTRIPAEA